jgi:hypothetical protein
MSSERPPRVIQEQHPVSRRWAIFEDDGVSAWLYLTEPDVKRPVADCGVYNRIAAPPNSDIERYRGGPPPACVGYAGLDARYSGTEPPEVCFRWSQDGEGVAVEVDGAPLGFVAPGTTRGVSRHLVRTGPWGNHWDEALFRRLFSP